MKDFKTKVLEPLNKMWCTATKDEIDLCKKLEMSRKMFGGGKFKAQAGA